MVRNGTGSFSFRSETITTPNRRNDFQGLPVPWKSIFLSAPAWAIVITHGCSVFGYFTVINQLPTYMKYILNFNIKQVRCFVVFSSFYLYIPLVGSFVSFVRSFRNETSPDVRDVSP